MRGDSASPRICFSHETLELIAPSRSHELIKGLVGRLLEVWTMEHDVELVGLGSFTLRAPALDIAVEPDQSYLIGTDKGDVPHLAIEIVWTHPVEHRLPIYASLGVRELWVWRAGELEVHVLNRRRYVRRSSSHLLPGLDLKLLNQFLAQWQNARGLVRKYQLALRSH